MLLSFEYWPSLSWMKQLVHADEVMLEQWGTYQKQSSANRCKILNDKGPLMLSVPLVGGRERKNLLKEVKIDQSQRWQVQHLRSLRSCYGKAPFFEHYFPLVENLLTQSFHQLVDLNYCILIQLMKWLKLNQRIHLTTAFQKEWAFPSKQNTATVTKSYQQVFSYENDFTPNLSVLDALFCLGPGINEYLRD